MSGSRYFFFAGLLGAWLSAEAATAFTLAGVLGLLSSLAAVVATLADVFSLLGFFVAMAGPLLMNGEWNFHSRQGAPAARPASRWGRAVTRGAA